MLQSINIDINALLYAGGTFVFGLFGLIGYLLKIKVGDIDKKIDKKQDVTTCNAIHNNIIENVVSRIENIIRNESVDNALRKLSHSPISLKEQDRKIIKETKFDEYVEKNKEKFIDYFDKHRPRNRAEGIKETAILVMMLDEKREIDLDKLKDAGYKIGKTETDIQIIAGVYIWQNIIEPFLYNYNETK